MLSNVCGSGGESEDEKVSPLESNMCATDFLATSFALFWSSKYNTAGDNKQHYNKQSKATKSCTYIKPVQQLWMWARLLLLVLSS